MMMIMHSEFLIKCIKVDLMCENEKECVELMELTSVSCYSHRFN